MQSTDDKITKAQASRAKSRVMEILQNCPGWGDSGVGISRDNKGYAVQLHLTHPLSNDIDNIIRREAGCVPVKAEVTGKAWAF